MEVSGQFQASSPPWKGSCVCRSCTLDSTEKKVAAISENGTPIPVSKVLIWSLSYPGSFHLFVYAVRYIHDCYVTF